MYIVSNFNVSCLEFLLLFELIWNLAKLVLLKGLIFFP